MTESTTAARQDPPLDPNGRIAADVTCRQCEYSLRGLSLEATCPECGTAVRWSIYGDRLLYANPAWARRLADGLVWVLIATFVAIITGVLHEIVALLTSASIEHVGALAAAVLGVVGYWLVTTPEPGRVEERPIWNVRAMTRILVLVGAVPALLALLRYVVFPPAGPQTASWAHFAVAVPLELARYTSFILFHLLLYRLAMRIPNVRLARVMHEAGRWIVGTAARIGDRE